MLQWMRERAWPTLKTIADRWDEDEGFLRSAAMAYYAAFSLFPLCLVLMAGLGLVSRISVAVQVRQQDFLSLIEETVSPWLAQQLGALLADVKTQAGVGGPLGFVALVLGAMGIFVQLDGALDRIWGKQPSSAHGLWGVVRGVLVDRLTAFLMLAGLGALLGMVLIFNLVLAGAEQYIESWYLGSYLWKGVQILFTPLTYALVFTVIYKVLPKGFVRWGEAAAGGVLVAVVWWVGQYVLQLFVIGENYSAYGVVGSFIAVLLWLYYASAAVFLGAEFVSVNCAACPRRRAAEGPKTGRGSAAPGTDGAKSATGLAV